MVKRKKLSVEDKMTIIRCFERGESNSLISQKFCLSSSTVSTILKNHKVITDAYQKNQASARRLRKADKADLDDALFEWLKEQKNKNVPISRKMLKEQAEVLATGLGYENFVCGHSWLDRFKNRHKFQYGVCENSTVPKIEQNWLEIWPNLKCNYSECDIFIIDKTEMSYKISSRELLGSEFISEDLYRCEVILCTNMTGSEKQRLLVVGKEESPEVFENLPVVYFVETEELTINNILEREIQIWDRELQAESREILLLLGNLNFELKVDLANIRVINVPYDSVSILNEIILNFQSNFREMLLDSQIKLRKIKPRSGYQLTFVEGINYLYEAWERITPDKIVISLRASGLTQSEVPVMNPVFEFFEVESKTEPLWCDGNSDDENSAAGPSGITYLEIDCDAVKLEPDDESSDDMPELKKEVKTEPAWNETVEDEDKKDETEDYSVQRVSKSKAQEAIKILELFYESNRGINPAFKTHLDELKGILRKKI